MYGRRVNGKVLTFGIEGVLYRHSFIMYDRQTSSLWIHATGEAVKGSSSGKFLKVLASVVTPWDRWKKRHPNTTILRGKRASGGAGHFSMRFTPAKYGLSIGQGETPKLYPIAHLAQVRVLNDEHDGLPIVLLWDQASGTGEVYERGVHTFFWKDAELVDETGRAWDALRATPIDKKAAPLRRVAATPWLVERWTDFHPHGAVYAPEPK